MFGVRGTEKTLVAVATAVMEVRRTSAGFDR